MRWLRKAARTVKDSREVSLVIQKDTKFRLFYAISFRIEKEKTLSLIISLPCAKIFISFIKIRLKMVVPVPELTDLHECA